MGHGNQFCCCVREGGITFYKTCRNERFASSTFSKCQKVCSISKRNQKHVRETQENFLFKTYNSDCFDGTVCSFQWTLRVAKVPSDGLLGATKPSETAVSRAVLLPNHQKCFPTLKIKQKQACEIAKSYNKKYPKFYKYQVFESVLK